MSGLLDQLTENLTTEVFYIVASVDYTLRDLDWVREQLVVEEGVECIDSLRMESVVLSSLGRQQNRLPIRES